MTQVSRILVGMDFSQPARDAFEHALALSTRHKAELVAVHAVPPDHAFSWHARARLALKARLRQKAARARVEFTSRVQIGDPAEIILLHAQSLRPDVIVVGTHQRTGMDRLRQRSVAERVAAKATVPVLLVPERRRTATTRPFRHVAVAVDFSAASHRAVEQALALATAAGDRVTLIHVVPGFDSGVPPHLYRYGIGEHQDRAIREARRRLHMAIPLELRTPAVLHTRVLVGDTTTELNRVADSIGADLLVVGMPRRGALSRALFGTTAVRLLRSVRLPMLVVPETAGAATHEDRTTVQAAA